MNTNQNQSEPYYGPIGSQRRLERLYTITADAALKFFEQPGVQEEFEIWQEEYHRTGKIFNSKLKETKCCDI